jgi:hypothetical protein
MLRKLICYFDTQPKPLSYQRTLRPQGTTAGNMAATEGAGGGGDIRNRLKINWCGGGRLKANRQRSGIWKHENSDKM